MKKKVVFKKYIIRVILLFVIFGGLFGAGQIIASSSGENNGFSLKTYFSTAGENLNIFFNSLFHHLQTRAENKSLTEENYQLKALLNEYSQIKAENDILKEALNLKKTSDFDFSLADIIGRSFLNFSKEIIINQGEELGLVIGDSVIGPGKSLVGEIKEIMTNKSFVRVINDSEFRAAVFVGSNQMAEAIFKGQGINQPSLEMLPTTVDVSVGDLIFTSGLDQKFPRGLILGKIKNIKKINGETFQDVEIELAFNWNELRQVLVIKND